MMLPITFERRYPLLIGEPDAFDITLVGCGGTGSFLAQDLARLAYHAREQNIKVNLTFVDFDRVEAKNIGRQNFSPAEVGLYKAETLANRFNRAFGLDIRVVNHPIRTFDVNYGLLRFNLIIGAVDNALARQDIARIVENADGRIWWLDCGNLYAEGQIVLGNVVDWDSRIAFPGTGFCHVLPAPHIIRPALLTAAPTPTALSCAELTLQDVQGLMTNRAMATFAAQYLYRLVITRSLDIFMTFIDLNSGVSSSLPINRTTIEGELALA